MTIGWIIAAALAAIVILGFGFAIVHGLMLERPILGYLAVVAIAVIITGGIVGFGYWYCNNTANGARALKDQQSNFDNGLMREITITAEDGREIFYYRGKCDIETNNGYILFEGEDNLRRMIYYGALDTIIIEELPTE